MLTNMLEFTDIKLRLDNQMLPVNDCNCVKFIQRDSSLMLNYKALPAWAGYWYTRQGCQHLPQNLSWWHILVGTRGSETSIVLPVSEQQSSQWDSSQRDIVSPNNFCYFHYSFADCSDTRTCSTSLSLFWMLGIAICFILTAPLFKLTLVCSGNQAMILQLPDFLQQASQSHWDVCLYRASCSSMQL